MKQKKSIEDYLKTIYILSSRGCVRGADIAKALNVSRPTVSVALRELSKEGYLFLGKSHEVYLTETGQCIAEATYDRHSTFQQLLTGLGVDEETAAADACEMEHTVSPESFAALKRLMTEQKQENGDAPIPGESQ